MGSHSKYVPLDKQEHSASRMSDEYCDDEALPCMPVTDRPHSRQSRHKRLLQWMQQNAIPRMNKAGVLLTIILMGAAMWGADRLSMGSSNAPRFRPQWSPMNDRLKIPVIEKTLDPFIPWRPEHPENIYSRDPSPETDAAWDKINEAMTFIPLSDADARRIGKDPSYLVQIPEGMRHAGSYLSTQDAIHQIHCLDYLRRALVHNYHYYWGNKWGFWPPFSFMRHTTHCVDILRQQLMCNADMEVHTYNWRVADTIKFPDFGIKKTCRDFNVLLQYLEDSRPADMVEYYKNISKPPNANELPAAPGRAQYLTNDTIFNSAGTALTPLTGLKDTKYCLGKGSRDTFIEQ